MRISLRPPDWASSTGVSQRSPRKAVVKTSQRPWAAQPSARGRLEAVLTDHAGPPHPVHALFTREHAALPKLRVFMDWAAERLAEAAPARKR